MSLFKQDKPKKAVRVARVEILNSEKSITQSMSVSQDQKEYTVCLCLSYKTVKTTFLSEFSALDQMRKNRALYKVKRV
jgi:hypothetical protein